MKSSYKGYLKFGALKYENGEIRPRITMTNPHYPEDPIEFICSRVLHDDESLRLFLKYVTSIFSEFTIEKANHLRHFDEEDKKFKPLS